MLQVYIRPFIFNHMVWHARIKTLVACAVAMLICGAGVTGDISKDFQKKEAEGFTGYHQDTCGFCYDAITDDREGFSAENITFDDAWFKGTDTFHPFEWWYFDAVFENNYSVEFHIDLAMVNGVGTVAPMVNIYRDGELISHEQRFLLPGAFDAHQEHRIILSGTTFLEGYVNATGCWIFNVSLHLGECGVDLRFASMTEGWKAKILNMWWWGVIQPKAQVTGHISFRGERMEVSGVGYHEHGWDATFPTVEGWYWGKVTGTAFTIIWTDVVRHPWKEYLMMVVNEDGGGYVNIPLEDITISMTNYTYNDGWKIPTSFRFTIENETIRADISAETVNIVHQISFGPFNYWRYHVHVQGTVTREGHMERIDSFQIMDLTRFW